MKQIFAIVLLALTLAGCDSEGGGNSYAAQLRARADGQSPPGTFNNGQPGYQTPTALRPAPTVPALPERPVQNLVMPTPLPRPTEPPTNTESRATGDIVNALDFTVDDGTFSLAAFVTSPFAMFGFAAIVAGLAGRAVRKKGQQ